MEDKKSKDFETTSSEITTIISQITNKVREIRLLIFLAVITSFAPVLDSIVSSATIKDFFIQNTNLLYFVLIITPSLIFMISSFLFLLRKDKGRTRLRQQITNAFIEAIENSSLGSNLKVKE